MKRHVFTLMIAVLFSLVSVGVVSAAPGLQGGTVHYVTYGDTLYSIAHRYGVPAEAIMRSNGLVNPNMIYVGQPLSIPGSGYGHSAPGCANYHVVAPGDTLSEIAYQYGISMKDLMRHNNLYNRDMVYTGQKLCTPGGYHAKPVTYRGAEYYHKVIRGETLHVIANRHGIDYHEIMNANSLYNPGMIYAGQELLIPGYQPAPAPPPVVEKHYAPPPAPAVVPPPVPVYDGGPAKVVKKQETTQSPPAPEYQAAPANPLLPEADHPIEVVVNGGETWVGEVYPNFPDPDGDTVLIVSTYVSDKPVVRLRSGDYEIKGHLGRVPEFGVENYKFAFRFIPAGDYDVWFEDPDGTPSEKVPVSVEPGKRVEVNFVKGVSYSGPTFASPDGWVLSDWINPSEPGKNLGSWSNILVKTPASGLNVIIESDGGGYQAKCFTGTKGDGACDFAGLSAGLYRIKIDGTDLTVKTYMDGNAYAEFVLSRQPSSSSEAKNFVGPVDYSD